MPYSPEHGDPKSAPSAHGRHGRLAHAGVVCAKNALGRTQPSATPLRDYPRPCNHPPRLDVLLVFGSMPPGTRSLVAAPERRTRLQLDKTIGSPGRAYSAASDRAGRSNPSIQHIGNAAHQNGNGLPAADRFCRWHAHCRFGDLKAWPNARAADGSSRKTSGRSQRSRGAHGPHHAPIC